MKTKLYTQAVRILLVRLCLGLGIVGIGFLYPIWKLRYDPDISTPAGQVDFRAAGIPSVALCIGVVYAAIAGWRFYCTVQDLKYDARFQSPPRS